MQSRRAKADLSAPGSTTDLHCRKAAACALAAASTGPSSVSCTWTLRRCFRAVSVCRHCCRRHRSRIASAPLEPPGRQSLRTSSS